MSTGLARLLFDECLPIPFVTRLADFLDLKPNGGTILCPLLEFAPSGTFDEDWIPRIKDEDWTVISADGGRGPNKKRGAKLPRLCAENGVTLILLSPKVHERKVLDKTRTIISVWDRIVEIASDPACRGRRFMVESLGQQNLVLQRRASRTVPHGPSKSQEISQPVEALIHQQEGGINA